MNVLARYLSFCLLFSAVLSAGLAAAAETVPVVIEQPGTQPGEVGNLESPGKCDNCHGGYNTAVEPDYNWRGSMMAHAGRDPIFWATLAIAEQDFDGSGDLCLRCHSTGGWLAGRSTPTDGSGLASGDSDGVMCDYCHKLTNPDNSDPVLQGVMNPPYVANDGTEGYYGSGMGSIWDNADKLGPYLETAAPHQFLQSAFHRSVDFCGTCHDVSNPAVGNLAHNAGAQATADSVTADGSLSGEVTTKAAFNNPPYKYGIVERTFSEYKSGLISRTRVNDFPSLPADLQGGALAAIYNDATANGTRSGDYEDGTPRYYSCQTCHMRPVFGQGCNKNPPFRNDLPLHDMTGGNYWMPDAITYLDNLGQLRLGGGMTALQTAAMNDGKLRAMQQLNLAASLNVSVNTVRIVNHTGHKLISGYPEGRRMWLNIKWYNDNGTLLREDGEYGTISVDIDGSPAQVETIIDLHDPNTKIYEAHYGMDQEWATQLVALGYSTGLPLGYDRTTGGVAYTLGELAADAPGTEYETFHFVLNNIVVKDNRIPPYGMQYDTARVRNTLPVPVGQFGNPGSGGTFNYWDEVALNPPTGAVSATIDLLYQPTSWEYIQFLHLANNGRNTFLADEGINMLDAWLNTGMAEPYVMASALWGNSTPACNAPAPTLVSTTAGNGEVALAWTDEHSGDTQVAGYKVYYDQSGKAQLRNDVGLVTNHTDTGLTNGQVYCYKITSYYDQSCESGFSNIVCAIPRDLACGPDSDGLPCDDGDFCTTNDTCQGGVCTGGLPPDCDDGNICTDDSCNSAIGCVNVFNTAPCNDSNVCTTVDTCSSGSCTGGSLLDCDDTNICTDDSCDPFSGCVNINNAAPCDDGDACTTNDACTAGSCSGGPPLNCNDENVCTDDSCNSTSGCVYANNTSPCDDKNACTTVDICSDGNCLGGSFLNCEDNNDCTDDSCDPANGCVYICSATNTSDPCCLDQVCTDTDFCAFPWTMFLQAITTKPNR